MILGIDTFIYKCLDLFHLLLIHQHLLIKTVNYFKLRHMFPPIDNIKISIMLQHLRI